MSALIAKHEPSGLRWTVDEDDAGLFYFVYIGLDTLLYHGRSYREASRVYSGTLAQLEGT